MPKMFADVMKVFNESKHRRVRGRFADIPGKGDDAPKKGRGVKLPAGVDPKRLRYVQSLMDWMKTQGAAGAFPRRSDVREWIRQDIDLKAGEVYDNAPNEWMAEDKMQALHDVNYDKEIDHVLRQFPRRPHQPAVLSRHHQRVIDLSLAHASEGGRLMVNGKVAFAGLGNPAGMHGYAAAVNWDKYSKRKLRLTDKLAALPRGAHIDHYQWRAKNRDRGNWVRVAHHVVK
jgi:hypothetical protein